jgi:hypothetical protein
MTIQSPPATYHLPPMPPFCQTPECKGEPLAYWVAMKQWLCADCVMAIIPDSEA